MMKVIGVDIGGTKIKAGTVDQGQVLQQSYVEVDIKETSKQTLNRVFQCIDQLISPSVGAIGVGIPGLVDVDHGIVYDIQNIPSWKTLQLSQILESRYHIPVFLNNDANCFAIGEKQYGKGRAYQNFIGLSVGTGLGMGVIVNHRLYSGVLSGAGEIGMLPYKDSIFEYYAGSFFFSRNYNKSAKELHDLAKLDDKEALDAFLRFGKHLGEAIKSIVYLFAPEAIFIGGSISKAYAFFKKSMHATLGSYAYARQIENLMIAPSDMEESAILGAAALCFQKKGKVF